MSSLLKVVATLFFAVASATMARASSFCPATPPVWKALTDCRGKALKTNSSGQYLITDICGLQTIPFASTAKFVLGQNIDASCTSKKGWNGGFSPLSSFSGEIDGSGHWIDRLQITSALSKVGVFQDNYGNLTHLGLTNVVVNAQGNSVVGGLTAYNDSGATISVAFLTGRVSGTTNSTVGGLVGEANSSLVADSYSGADVLGTECVGGLVGTAASSSIMATYSSGLASGLGITGGLVGCSYQGSVDGSVASGPAVDLNTAENQSNFVGALVGLLEGPLSDAYATGTVTTTVSTTATAVGGLVGAKNNGSISQAFSAPAILTGQSGSVGGLVGGEYDGTGVTTSYWDTSTSNIFVGTGEGNEKGIVGRSTQQLQAGLPKGFNSNFWSSATPSAELSNSYPFLVGSSCAWNLALNYCEQAVQDTNCTDPGPSPYFDKNNNPMTGPDPFFCYRAPPMAESFVPALAQYVASQFLTDGVGVHTAVPIGQKDVSQYSSIANAESMVELFIKNNTRKYPAAAVACEGTAYAMLARMVGEIYSKAVVKPDVGFRAICPRPELAISAHIDCLLQDSDDPIARGTARWWGSLQSYATLSAYDYKDYTPLVDGAAQSSLLAGHQLILHGTVSGGGAGEHVMLVTSFLTDASGNLTRLVANDPELGRQVFIDMNTRDGKAYHQAVLNALGPGDINSYDGLSDFFFTADSYSTVNWVSQRK